LSLAKIPTLKKGISHKIMSYIGKSSDNWTKSSKMA